LLHVTSPHAESLPEQVARHFPVPQLIVPHAALPSEHVSVHAPPLQAIVPHAFEPEHVRVQSPVPHVSEPQAALPPPPLHVSVQLPVVHVTLAHAAEPVHVTLQSAAWHDTPKHALLAAHSTSHDTAVPQLIVPHAPEVGQPILHLKPAGQVMPPLPVPVMLHVAVAISQLVQTAGHTNASGGAASGVSMPTMQ
jgi:hypothetical protein